MRKSFSRFRPVLYEQQKEQPPPFRLQYICPRQYCAHHHTIQDNIHPQTLMPPIQMKFRVFFYFFYLFSM